VFFSIADVVRSPVRSTTEAPGDAGSLPSQTASESDIDVLARPWSLQEHQSRSRRRCRKSESGQIGGFSLGVLKNDVTKERWIL
jgi:hypothetical protein